MQTIASVAEGIAAGLAFTLPALIFLQAGKTFNIYTATIMALLSGALGLALSIVFSKGLTQPPSKDAELNFPESRACATVLLSPKNSQAAGAVYSGLLAAAGFSIGSQVLALWKQIVTPAAMGATRAFKNAVFGMELAPELLGVGYFIGFRPAATMLSGGIVAFLTLIPLLSEIVKDQDAIQILQNLGIAQIWLTEHPSIADHIYYAYVRPFSVGVILGAGLIRLIETIPSIIENITNRKHLAGSHRIPILLCIGTLSFTTILLVLVPSNGASLIRVVLLGFTGASLACFFAFISFRFVGTVGGSANPVSAMTIAALMITGGVALVKTVASGTEQTVLIMGAAVCICAATCGAASQAIVVGPFVKARRSRQAVALAIGLLVSGVVCGLMLVWLHVSARGPIGQGLLQAPQANMMSALIKGIFAEQLDWNKTLSGALLAISLRLCGVNSLLFGVGMYLPLSTTVTICLGGALRTFAEKIKENKRPAVVKVVAPVNIDFGECYATGLIAGGTLISTALALGTIRWEEQLRRLQIGEYLTKFNISIVTSRLAVLLFIGLAYMLYRFASKIGNEDVEFEVS